jgi:hypothetical protein
MNVCRSEVRVNEPEEGEGGLEGRSVEGMSPQEDEVDHEESEEQREVESIKWIKAGHTYTFIRCI